MRNTQYEKLLLSELRLFPVEESGRVTDLKIQKAMTINENLISSVRYSFKPEDIIRLAKQKNKDLDQTYERFISLLDKVKAEPMYPDFPKQVMEMDKATFRMHQLIHYFSTYGIESLSGESVSKGWLPPVERTEKKVEDKTLLGSKIVELLSLDEMYIIPMKKILSKKQRMTNPDVKIIEECLKNISLEEIKDISVPFKENISILFNEILTNNNIEREKGVELLYNVCQHTGDVLKCAEAFLQKNERFKTSEKRAIVKLIEKYPAADLAGNIMLSHKKEETNKKILKSLSYNDMSKSQAHKDIVKNFRDGKIKSWESEAKKRILEGDKNALSFCAQRPGILLRWSAWLMRLGFDPKNALMENANKLSMPTLVELATHFGQNFEKSIQLSIDKKNTTALKQNQSQAEEMLSLLKSLIEEKMKHMPVVKEEIFGKKIYFDQGNIDFKQSVLCGSQSPNGGYLRKGMAVKIPEDTKYVRFFVYWDDTKRVDVDLHAAGLNKKQKQITVGWNSHYKKDGVVHSGDITHSDAAEYIDVDMNNEDLDFICSDIHLYSGQPNFKDIDTCFTGMMAVSEIGKDVKLYNQKNTFFSHNLDVEGTNIDYAVVDVAHKSLKYIGEPNSRGCYNMLRDSKVHKYLENQYTLMDYLTTLCNVNGAKIVENKEEADVIFSVEKSSDERAICLTDNNYFLEADENPIKKEKSNVEIKREEKGDFEIEI